MTQFRSDDFAVAGDLPGWLPAPVRLYLDHTEAGLSLRELARREGCHASTVMRQVRRFENRRDDPLVDEALSALGRAHPAAVPPVNAPQDGCPAPDPDQRNKVAMAAHPRPATLCDEATISREAQRILRRLCETGAILIIAPDMEKAIVLRPGPDGTMARTAVLDRTVAQAFALKDWIACRTAGRVAQYEITGAGRAALRRILDDPESHRGFAEAQSAFAAQHRDFDHRDISDDETGASRRHRVNLAESPVAALARRRDKDGKPFLSPDLVSAAERLREDFELAQMGTRVTQNWDRFLTAGARGAVSAGGPGEGGSSAARERVASALRDLGPGLGDMVLRCCCYLEGLETAERRMGWSARSGKIVLRIALVRLKRHYDEVHGGAPMIG